MARAAFPLVVVVLSTFSLFSGCEPPNNRSASQNAGGPHSGPAQQEGAASETASAPLPQYEILDRTVDESTFPDAFRALGYTQQEIEEAKRRGLFKQMSRVRVAALVWGDITEAGLKALLAFLRRSVEEDPELGAVARERGVRIFLYTDRERYEDGYKWVGRLLYNPKEGETVEVNRRQLARRNEEPETRDGLTEAQRKEVFKNCVWAEDRASAEAEKQFPVGVIRFGDPQLEKQADCRDRLTEKYKSELAKEYKLTRQQLDAIVAEAMEKEWPLPGDRPPTRTVSKLEMENRERTASAYLRLAKRLAAKGKTQKAKEGYQEVVDKFPETKSAAEARDLLKGVK